MTIKFFDSGILNNESELTEDEAIKSGFYNKVYYENNQTIKSEFIKGAAVSKVVYFNHDPKDAQLINKHKTEYGDVKMEVCITDVENAIYSRSIYYFDKDFGLVSYSILKGKKEWYWEEETRYSPEGETWEFIKYIYEGDHDLVKEIHYKADGSFWYELDQD